MMRLLTILIFSGLLMNWKTSDEEIVKVSTSKIIMHAGKQSVVNVSVDVMKGYHIQANKVKNEFMIPTTLEINVSRWFDFEKQIFPPTKKFKLEGTDESLNVYDGRFEILAYLTTNSQTPKGIYNLDGKLKYQACDSIHCLFPRTVEFLINVNVQ